MPYEWVTLQEAAARTGISISSIRKWYGKGMVDAREVRGPYGPQKMVRIDQIEARVERRAEAVEVRASVAQEDTVETLARALATVTATNAALTARLEAAERALAIAERVVEKMAGSAYAARVLVEAES